MTMCIRSYIRAFMYKIPDYHVYSKHVLTKSVFVSVKAGSNVDRVPWQIILAFSTSFFI